jgi:hypothetical protein
MDRLIVAGVFMGEIKTMPTDEDKQIQFLTRQCIAELFYFHEVLSDDEKRLLIRYVCGGDPGQFDAMMGYNEDISLAYLEEKETDKDLPPFFRLALDNKVKVAFVNNSGVVVIDIDTVPTDDFDSVVDFLEDPDTFNLVMSVCMACQDKRCIVYNKDILWGDLDTELRRFPMVKIKSRMNPLINSDSSKDKTNDSSSDKIYLNLLRVRGTHQDMYRTAAKNLEAYLNFLQQHVFKTNEGANARVIYIAQDGVDIRNIFDDHDIEMATKVLTDHNWEYQVASQCYYPPQSADMHCSECGKRKDSGGYFMVVTADDDRIKNAIRSTLETNAFMFPEDTKVYV